jgi:hypothetical protein
MIDVRVNGYIWKEFKDPSKAADALGCGYYDNGEFDYDYIEAAKRMLKIRSGNNIEEIKEEAQRFLDGEIDKFELTWLRDDIW